MSQLAAKRDIPASEALEAARQNPGESLRTGQGSALGAIALNGLIGLLKLAAGLLGHSYALLADAAESFTDVFSSSISLFGLTVAATPADRTHPFGHSRAETLASAAVRHDADNSRVATRESIRFFTRRPLFEYLKRVHYT